MSAEATINRMNRVDKRQKKLMEETRYGAKGINRGEREVKGRIEGGGTEGRGRENRDTEGERWPGGRAATPRPFVSCCFHGGRNRQTWREEEGKTLSPHTCGTT